MKLDGPSSDQSEPTIPPDLNESGAPTIPPAPGSIALVSNNGFARAVSKRTWSDNIDLTRFNPLSPPVEQMLLGVLLGDGRIDWQNTIDGRFSIRHGAKQRAYCEFKAVLLADYIKTPPKIVPNGGWGDENCVFTTITTPVFGFLRKLCYVQDPRYPSNPRRLIRRVNPAWLSRLTWEGISFWYMDDGTLEGSVGGCRVVQFCTHRYSREEVELLAAMLRDRGIDCKACPTRKGQKVYWTIRLTAGSTRLFVQKIAPFVHPTMMYKIDAPERDLPNCVFCGAIVDTRRFNPDRPCCRSCRRLDRGCKARRRHARNRQIGSPGRRQIQVC